MASEETIGNSYWDTLEALLTLPMSELKEKYEGIKTLTPYKRLTSVNLFQSHQIYLGKIAKGYKYYFRYG
jgi:hypothetical protein